MLRKSFFVSLVSLIGIFGSMYLIITFNGNSYDNGHLPYIIFYGTVTLLPPTFLSVYVFNILMEKRRPRLTIKWFTLLHIAYFIGISFLIVIGFSLFDYSQRGRYFDDSGFIDFVWEYSPTFVIAILVMLVNMFMTWKGQEVA